MARSTPPRVIKKYSNRRLYDTAESRYVTLDELALSIRGGVDVRVIDASTSGDLTQATLAQIILEGRGAAQFLTIPLLTQLIRMSDDALAEFLGRYLSGALELYLQARSGAQTLAPYAPFATVPFAATNALARLLSGISPWGSTPAGYPQPQPYPQPYADPTPPPDAPPPDAPATGTSPATTTDAVAELRRELDELKKALRPQRPRKKRA